MNETVFKQCQVCQKRWPTRQSFIDDAEIVLIGYQANIAAVDHGLFMFNHSCDGTLSIEAATFFDLYHGPIYLERKHDSADCPGYCLYSNELRSCPVKCDCAYVREILQLLRKPTPAADGTRS